jgi:fluoride ion exporter CrcB/FEX
MEESWVNALQHAITDFKSGWFLGAITLCYLCINVLRGKAGFNIPYLTEWLEKQKKEVKTYAIVGFCIAVGFFSSFASPKVTVSVVVNGIIEGLAYAAGIVGVRNVVKQGIEGTQTYLENKKTGSDK